MVISLFQSQGENGMKKALGWVSLSCIVVMLAGCGKGLDARLPSITDREAFLTSVQKASEDMNDVQRIASSWAFNNISDSELESKYKHATPREIINGVADSQINKITQELNELEPNRAAFEKIRDEILKVHASEPTYELGKDFLGDQTNIHVDIANRGNKAFSMLVWQAKLYINNSDQPVAHADILDFYTQDDDGLNPGEQQKRTFTISGMDSEAWHTLEVKQAKSHKIELALVPDRAEDLGGRKYLADSPLPRISALQTELSATKTMKVLIVTK